MKSKRAKEYIQDKDNQLWGVSMGVPLYITFDVEKAITLAEQDAEERAVRAFCGTCSHSTYPTCDLDICIERERFKELLNNGGQSDE